VSLAIRPVIETWGDHMTYLTRGLHVSELIEAIAAQDESNNAFINNYGEEIAVVYIQDGEGFLRRLEAGPDQILKRLEEDGWLSAKSGEREPQLSDVRELCRMAPQWRRWLDPKDKSLRIYCD
jgi:hypothetical protein